MSSRWRGAGDWENSLVSGTDEERSWQSPRPAAWGDGPGESVSPAVGTRTPFRASESPHTRAS